MSSDALEAELLSVRETARRLGVHENTVRNWARNGSLPTARIPGSKFHRFRADDVERLQKQRGKAAPSLQSERRSINPELVTANVLQRWPGDASRDSQEHLPELVRRLLVETAGITNISVRTGDGIALGGWDGIADSAGSAFLPAGPLAFEMGVEANVKKKANDDYRNRVQAQPQDLVFVFVTPRRWRDKEVWAAERRADHKFRDVRVLDADDLEGWLKASPAAHFWISEHLGLQPRDARTIGEWWRRFHEQTNPQLPTGLFLAGREDLAKQLRTRVQDRPSLTTIQSESTEDCLSFTYAAIESEESDDAKTVVVVSSPDVWDRIVEQPGESVLIPLLENADVSAALDGGHHVISVIDRTSAARRAVDITLPRVDRRAAAQAFEALALDFRDADRLAVLGRRSLPALKRSIALDPRFKRPNWAHDDSASILACLVLAGSWTTSDYDMAILETLTGHPRAEVMRVAQSVSGTNDPVLRRVGSTWMVVSPEEAFLYLAESLTPNAIDRWRESARRVLLEPDPTLDMTGAERMSAQMEGNLRQVSSILSHGVATGVALLGAVGSTTSLDGIDSLSDIARRFVRELLASADGDETGRVWRQLAVVLPLLAEAAPDEFLTAVDSDLQQERPLLLSLFREDEDALSLGSGSLHPHLLWALETVCWSDDRLIDGIRALARLTEIEPGGKSGNRPIGSMSTILCGWVRNTAASLETRLAALDAAVSVATDVGWRLICDLWPSDHGWVMPPAAPHIRDDWAPANHVVTMAEWAQFAHELVVRAVKLAPGHGPRLCQLIEKLSPLPAPDRELIIAMLEQELEHGDLSESDRLEVWDAIRSVVRRHQRFSAADWAMPEEVLTKLDALAAKYEPSDAPERLAYLFSWHPDLPGVDITEHVAYNELLTELRMQAIESVLGREDGLDRIEALARRCEAPGQLGWALAASDSINFSDTVQWLSSDNASLREMAANYARRHLLLRGSPALIEALREKALTGSARELFLRCVPPVGESWSLLRGSPVAADFDIYWQTAPVDVVAKEDVLEAIAELIAHGRAWSAVDVVSFALHQSDKQPDDEVPLNAAVVVNLLNEVLRQRPSDSEVSQMSGYHLGEALDFLVTAGAEDTDIARFEFAFYRLLEHHRQPVVLDRALATEPELFVDLVKRVYRAKNEPRREKSEADSNLATQAWWVLRGWTGFPGRSDDGGINATLLGDWVLTARLLLSEADRADIGDEVIGQAFGSSPIGSDGAWPAEPIRDLIEIIGSRELENGLIIGRLNNRGITSRSVYEGGRQERDLSSQYRTWSKDTKAKWPRTSRILTAIAESYERDAKREDIEAEIDADRL
jgi:excisionase family DNA binding protein